jgi:putative peptide zinc metalloprotease protein
MSRKQPVKGKPKDLWQQLLADLPNPEKLDQNLGIWEEIRIKPRGVWKEARDETFVLARARPQKVNIWQEAKEETLLLPRPSRINVFHKVDEQLTSMERSKPQEKDDIWDALADETVILPRVKRKSSLPKIRDLSKMKPIRISGWALKKLETAKGETYWVLKNIERGTYLRLNEQQVYFWEQMDGAHSLQDLAVAMFLKYKTLGIDGLMDFIDQLDENGFLVDDRAVNVYKATNAQIGRRTVAYYFKRAARFLMKSEFSFKNIDRFYSVLYRLVGWALFSKLLLGLLILICILGFPAYVILAIRGELLLLGNTESSWLGLFTLWLAQLFAFFLHESAHALTTKHYGRTVRRGGVGLYLGLPAFFMDTTDIWMEPRGPRINVTMAGPMAGFVLGGITSILLLFSSTTIWAGFGFQFATFCMIGSVFNLNPLVKYDGYYILMDWLEIPMLRERSFRFLRQDLFKRLQKKEKLSNEEIIYSVYGAAATIFTGLAIISAIALYGKYIARFFSWINSIGVMLT